MHACALEAITRAGEDGVCQLNGTQPKSSGRRRRMLLPCFSIPVLPAILFFLRVRLLLH
jgi:hypothetical protein